MHFARRCTPRTSPRTCCAVFVALLICVEAATATATAAAAFPPVRVLAGERSAVAVEVAACEPQSGGLITACRTAALAAGPGFPPALAALPGSEIVVDTGIAATAVRVSTTQFDGGASPSPLPVRRIDDSRSAFSMPTANATASIEVEYARGGNTRSFLTLRRIVATSEGLSSVDAHGSVVAWSGRDAGTAARYHLTALVGGEVRRLPVASRSVPFDVDLGPDRRGRTVAVYSRCAREPELPTSVRSSPSEPYPPYTRGQGCDLYRFDFASGRERRVAGASTDQASEMLPSIWRDEIAFARVYEQRSGARGLVPYLYVRPLKGGRSRRQPGGARGRTGLPGPVSLDLRGSRLAFVWNRAAARGRVSELRLVTRGGRRVLDRTRGTTFLSPQGSDGQLLYAAREIVVQRDGERVDRLFRRRLSTDAVRVAGAPERLTGVAVTADGALFAASRDRDGGTAIIDVSDAEFFRNR